MSTARLSIDDEELAWMHARLGGQTSEEATYARRLISAFRATRSGAFRLVGEQMQADHQTHLVVRRDYPDLNPPASFVDCWTCALTWEIGR